MRMDHTHCIANAVTATDARLPLRQLEELLTEARAHVRIEIRTTSSDSEAISDNGGRVYLNKNSPLQADEQDGANIIERL